MGIKNSAYDQEIPQSQTVDKPVALGGRAPQQDTRKQKCIVRNKEEFISEIYMFIFQSKFDNPPHRDHIPEKRGTSIKNQWDFQISKVGSLDFLDMKVNGSPESSEGIISFEIY